MDNLEFWISGLLVILIIIIKYAQLKKVSSEMSLSIKQYLSIEQHIVRLFYETLIYLGLIIYLFIGISNPESPNGNFFAPIQVFPLALVIFGVSLIIWHNKNSFKPSELKRTFLSEIDLENKVSNSKKMLYFLLSAPLFVGAILLIEVLTDYDGNQFMGFDISDIPLWRLAIIVITWSIIYALMVVSAFELHKMSKHMLGGNLFGAEPIYSLKISSYLLQAMAFIIMFYSFYEGLLTGEISVSYLLKPLFWIAYFLAFMSLMIRYLSHVLQRAAILKEENDLTI